MNNTSPIVDKVNLYIEKFMHMAPIQIELNKIMNSMSFAERSELSDRLKHIKIMEEIEDTKPRHEAPFIDIESLLAIEPGACAGAGAGAGAAHFTEKDIQDMMDNKQWEKTDSVFYFLNDALKNSIVEKKRNG